MSKVKPILGYTDCITVKLDLDDMPYSEVKEIALKTTYYCDMQGFLILKSSKKCYHVVFNRYVTWEENVSIMGWVTLQLFRKYPKVAKWFFMQCIKGSSTLRATSKLEKPAPRIVSRFGMQNQGIENFLGARKVAKYAHIQGVKHSD